MKRNHVIILGLLLVFVAAVPVLHFSMQINPADPVPEHWGLPPRIGDWDGDRVFYSPDPSVRQVFFESKMAEPFMCPVSGAPLQLMSEAEVRLLPDDVEIERRLYRNANQQRWVIMLISGASREGIHRPEWCLMAQGFTIGDLRYIPVDYAEPFKIGIYPLLPENAPPDYQPRDFFVYWFEGPNDIRTPYHAERILRSGLDRILHGQVQRWAYFSIQLSIPPSVSAPDDYLAGVAKWLVEGQMSSL